MPTVDDVIVLVRRFIPPVLVAHATLGKDVETAFEYDEDLYDFGERLIMVGGLVLCGLYVSRAERDPDTRSDHYADFVRAMLFHRGYDRGLASAVFQRVGQVSGPFFAALQADHSAVIAFSRLRRQGAANTVRARMRDPLEPRLCDLVRSMRFLKRLRFRNNNTVTFDDEPIRLWPFLLWDGKHALRLREPRDRNVGGLPEAFEWVSSDESQSEIHALSTEQLQTLRRIAELVLRPATEEPVSIVPPAIESVIPLFADTHPQMCELAQLIQKKANRDTKAKLLTRYLKKERGTQTISPEEARAAAKDPRLVENAVIRQCVETDPVAVLKAYLESEPADVAECLELLAEDRAQAAALGSAISDNVERFHKALTPLYPDREEIVDREAEQYRALLAAKEVARLLGFRILEQSARDPIDAYINRVSAFEQYVRARERDLAKVATGLFECAKIAHEILRFLVAFYTSLKYYDPSQGDGITPGVREGLQAELHRVWRDEFAPITQKFARLREDAAIVAAVRQHLDRPIWSAKALDAHVQAMDEFRKNWRNVYAHQPGVIDRDAARIVARFLDFLKWLRDPARSESHRDRIYPAVLHLNVLTMNQCGITSVKYGLTEMSNPHERISLYTKQPLANLAGVFYGLPNQNKSQDDLWLDPVLIPSTIFVQGTPTHARRSKVPIRATAARS